MREQLISCFLKFLHVEDEEDEAGEGQRSTSSRSKTSSNTNNLIEIRVPKDQEERRYLGKKQGHMQIDFSNDYDNNFE